MVVADSVVAVAAAKVVVGLVAEGSEMMVEDSGVAAEAKLLAVLVMEDSVMVVAPLAMVALDSLEMGGLEAAQLHQAAFQCGCWPCISGIAD